MNKHCADWADLNKTPQKKPRWCHLHFLLIAVLFDVQMKTYAASWYFTKLRTVVCAVIKELKKKKAHYSQSRRPRAQRCSNFTIKMGLFSL